MRSSAPAAFACPTAAISGVPACARSFPFLRCRLQLSEQRGVALEPVRGDVAALDRGSDRTARLRDVAAVAISAFTDKGSHLGEAGCKLPRLDAPQSDFAEARRIHQVAPALERDHHGTDGGVGSPAHLAADLADPKAQAGLHCVEETRLAGPRRAGDHGNVSAQGSGELSNSRAHLDAGLEYHVARASESLGQHASGRQVHLVENDCGWNAVGFGDDEKAVDELRNRGGIGSGAHDEYFVDVRGDGARAAPLGHAPLEQRAAFVDPDDAVEIAAGLELEMDDVAHHHLRGIALRLSAEHRGHFARRRGDAIDGAVPLEHHAADWRRHHSPGDAAMASSSAAFTSNSEIALSRSSASSRERPQARIGVSTCPTGRSPPGDQRTKSSPAPKRPRSSGASSTKIPTEYAWPSLPPNAAARSCFAM